MTTQAKVIQGTAREIREALALIPNDEIVRLMVGRPSLSIYCQKITARGRNSWHDRCGTRRTHGIVKR